MTDEIVKNRKFPHLGSYLELWLLSFFFVIVVGSLLQLQNIKVQEQEVARSIQIEQMDTFNEITRNNTPALGY